MDTIPSSQKITHIRLAREHVMADLNALVVDAELLLKATANDASDKVAEARLRMAAALERAKNACAVLQEQGVDTAKAAIRKTDETIRFHPYESIGIAFGVGLLVGALLRRR